MQITPNKLTIKQLLSISNEQFIVPSYQRRYAWGRHQQAALFDDIALLKEGDNHLFGMILCHSDIHKAGLNQPELVDGQQRLTTLTLLLLALRDKFNDLGITKKVEEIDNLIHSFDLSDKRLNKVVLGELDKSDYQRIFKGEIDSEIVNRKLLDAYQHFRSWLDSYTKEETTVFYNKLVNVAVIIRLDVSLAKDAYKLFESINNRGLKLSPTDIIKNFILGHASKIDDDTLNKVKKLWGDIITNLDEIDTNQFLRQYMCMALGRRVSVKGLVDEFKAYYVGMVQKSDLLSDAEIYSREDEEEIDDEKEDDVSAEELETLDEGKKIDSEEAKNKIPVTTFLKQIKDASAVYRKIRMRGFEDNKINYHLLNLQRILSFPSYIFLLSLLSRDILLKEKLAVLRLVEIFMLRRHICLKRTAELDNIFAQLVKVSDENIQEKVSQSLREHLPDDEEFQNYFTTHDFKGRLVDRARYVLEQIEYHLIKDKGEYRLSTAEDVHLEHIMPQVINTKKARNEFGDWVEYLGESAMTKHRRYVSKIGNMTLLAGELNIKSSNNPFNNKKDNYKQSNIRLNDSLANYYRQFKFQQIDERGKELRDIALNIWKF